MSNTWRTTSRLISGGITSVEADNNNTGFAAINTAVNSSSYNINGYSNGSIVYTISNIGTNIVVKIQGSLDDTRWFNINSKTITSNDTYTSRWSLVARYIRFRVNSVSGGNPSVSNISLSANAGSSVEAPAGTSGQIQINDNGVTTGITSIPIANGGTNSTTVAGARTNLGLGTMATQSHTSVAITGGTASLTRVASDSILLNESSVIKVISDPMSIEAATGNFIPINNSGKGSVNINTIRGTIGFGQIITLMNIGGQNIVFIDDRLTRIRDSITCGSNITLAANTGSTITLIYSARGGTERGWVCIANHAN